MTTATSPADLRRAARHHSRPLLLRTALAVLLAATASVVLVVAMATGG